MGYITDIFVGIDVAKVRNAIAIADGERGGDLISLTRQTQSDSRGFVAHSFAPDSIYRSYCSYCTACGRAISGTCTRVQSSPSIDHPY